MSMGLKLALSCLGVFIGGMSGYYTLHQADALDARFWVGVVMSGLAPLGAYFVGLNQTSPWDNKGQQPPAGK